MNQEFNISGTFSVSVNVKVMAESHAQATEILEKELKARVIPLEDQTSSDICCCRFNDDDHASFQADELFHTAYDVLYQNGFNNPPETFKTFMNKEDAEEFAEQLANEKMDSKRCERLRDSNGTKYWNYATETVFLRERKIYY